MFAYDPRTLPEPGAGPFITTSELKKGTRVLGLAPIGVRWRAVVKPSGGIKPEGNCPRSEFVPTHAQVGDQWFEIKEPAHA